MGRVTAYAGRDFRVVEFHQSPPVDRDLILGDLVHAKRGIVALHELRIRVAAAANRRDLAVPGHADVPFGGIHGFEATLPGVTAMAGDAAEPLGRMHVFRVLLHRRGQASTECSVTNRTTPFRGLR